MFPGVLMPEILNADKLSLPHRPKENQNIVICIAGMKGSGKTEVVRAIGEKMNRWFHFDTQCEHKWIPDRHETVEDGDWYLMEKTQTGVTEFHGSYEAHGDDLERDLNLLSDSVYDCRNLTFCVEELPMMSGPGHAPKKFMKVARTGRHAKLNVIYTCQRVAETPVTLRSQTDIFIFFFTAEPRDLEAIAERCGAEIERQVTALGDHEFLIWDVKAKKRIAYSELVGVYLPRFQHT